MKEKELDREIKEQVRKLLRLDKEAEGLFETNAVRKNLGRLVDVANILLRDAGIYKMSLENHKDISPENQTYLWCIIGYIEAWRKYCIELTKYRVRERNDFPNAELQSMLNEDRIYHNFLINGKEKIKEGGKK